MAGNVFIVLHLTSFIGVISIVVFFLTFSGSPGWPQSCYIAKEGLEPLLLLPVFKVLGFLGMCHMLDFIALMF